MIWFQYIREGTCRSAYCSSTTAALQENLLKSCFKESRMQWDSCHSYCTVVGDSSRLYGCIWSQIPKPGLYPTRIQLKLKPYIRRGFVTRNLCQRWVEWEQVSSILLIKTGNRLGKKIFFKNPPCITKAGRKGFDVDKGCS